MRDSKLLILLQKMSDKELQNLYDLVKSPYFNKKNRCSAVLRVLAVGKNRLAKW